MHSDKRGAEESIERSGGRDEAIESGNDVRRLIFFTKNTWFSNLSQDNINFVIIYYKYVLISSFIIPVYSHFTNSFIFTFKIT